MSSAMVIDLNEKRQEIQKINSFKQLSKKKKALLDKKNNSNNKIHLNDYELYIIKLFRELSEAHQWRVDGRMEELLLKQLLDKLR